jgi:hypothetical protein
MLAAALTAREDLVLQDAGTRRARRPRLPGKMYWVWGVPIEDIPHAEWARKFMYFAFLFHKCTCYEVAFVRPDGTASPTPILYGLTNAADGATQLAWLATGEGNMPL